MMHNMNYIVSAYLSYELLLCPPASTSPTVGKVSMRLEIKSQEAQADVLRIARSSDFRISRSPTSVASYIYHWL